MKKNKLSAVFFVVLLALNAFLAHAQDSAGNKGFFTVQQILTRSCSACHDWTGSYEGITDPSRVVPGSPEKSDLWVKISDDTMPMKGPKLTSLEKALIKSWISAGAPSSDAPISQTGAEAAAGASAGAIAPAIASAPSSSFLGFPNKVVFHEVSGFTSAAFFFAAGIIGVVHFLDMMNEGHNWRDANWNENLPNAESLRSSEITTAWGDNQALRWWHVGFIVAGESLYLANAITGISMWSKDGPGMTPQKLHKIAFITHVSLLAAQIALGFLSSYALQTGQHDLMIGLGAAHAAIGITIPLVMTAAGVTNMLWLSSL